jgi:hypothetical protein
MKEENKDNQDSGAVGAQADSSKSVACVHPVTVPHLLYKNWRALKIDGRSWYAKRKKELITRLLEPFNGQIPATVKILAEITTINLLIARRLEGFIQTTPILPSNTLRDYVTLTNSTSGNLQRLYEMATNSAAKPNIPGLEEYLKSCGAKVVEDKERKNP